MNSVKLVNWACSPTHPGIHKFLEFCELIWLTSPPRNSCILWIPWILWIELWQLPSEEFNSANSLNSANWDTSPPHLLWNSWIPWSLCIWWNGCIEVCICIELLNKKIEFVQKLLYISISALWLKKSTWDFMNPFTKVPLYIVGNKHKKMGSKLFV